MTVDADERSVVPGPALRDPPDDAGPDDAVLVRAWCAGDGRAFDALYARWSRPVWRYHRLRSGAERAEELHQDTWLAVIRGRDGYGERERFPAWLFTLARNCAIDAARRRSARPPESGAAEAEPDALASGADPEADAERDARIRRLHAALRTLPTEQRDVIALRWEAGLTLPEIAAHTDVSVDTVKSRLRYALERLRRELPDHGQ